MNKTKKRFLHFAITIVFVAIGALGMAGLTSSRPQIKKHKPPPAIPVVRAIRIKTGPQTIHIPGEGTVKPLREIDVVPQVGGKVIYISSALVNGGEFKKGDTLLRIDPADYQLAVTLAEARVKDSESNLRITEEGAAVAREEWGIHNGGGHKTDKKPPPLVAKEPQLAAARARLSADLANLQKALLDLKRTELKAPFDGRVSKKDIDIGQYVKSGQDLAAIYSIESAEIVVPLKDDDLSWFHVPGFTPGDGPGSRVTVRARVAGHELSWSGKVVRAEGKIDERTRMVNVVVRVEKPYAQKPPLAAGLFVTVDIKGLSLHNAAVIPRSALYQGDVVRVVDKENRLHLHKVEVARLFGDKVIVKAGLKDGEMVAVSNLKVVTDGMAVRTVSS